MAQRRWFSRRLVLRIGGALVAGYVGVLGVLLACEDRLVYHPAAASKRWQEPPAGFTPQEVALRTADGSAIHARWFARTGARGAVLICHGQAGNVSTEMGSRQLTGWQQQVGVSVLLFDYPGYGRSEGRPSEAGCYAAAEAAYAWLTQEQGVPPDEVLLYGRSLGTGVAVDLASRHRHRALILVSPYTSLPAVAVRRFALLPAPLVMRNRFPSLDKIAGCQQPVLIVHGTADELVPFALGQALFAAANEPKRFLAVPDGRHGGGLPAAFFPSVCDFLRETATPPVDRDRVEIHCARLL